MVDLWYIFVFRKMQRKGRNYFPSMSYRNFESKVLILQCLFVICYTRNLVGEF